MYVFILNDAYQVFPMSAFLTFRDLDDVSHANGHLTIVDGVPDDGHCGHGSNRLPVLPGGVQQARAVLRHVHVVHIHLDRTVTGRGAARAVRATGPSV